MSEQTVLPLELRRASDIDGVHTLEGLCVPYGRTTLKAGFPRGERFVSGAFRDAVAGRAKVRLRDIHGANDNRRPVAVSTGFEETGDGLVGRFRFYNTPEGRGAWENVSEGTYGGLSVGFYAVKDRTASDGAREVLTARLHHVALVDEPAYEEAQILAVRAAREPLPDVGDLLSKSYNLDDIPNRVDLSSIRL